MINFLQRRAVLMAARRIGLVLDVGANRGQFASALRRDLGYRGRIVSFEPLKDAFALLQQAAAADSLWSCHNIALGDTNGTATINISANSYSSSLLEATEQSLRIEPAIGYVGTQDITIRKLDDLLAEVARPDELIYLKIDTQGYELNVLNGALSVLRRFALIQIETSFFQVYKNEPLIADIITFMDCLGYRIVSIEPGWEDDKTGELLQADLIFGRK